MEQYLEIETITIELLLVVSLVAIVVRRLRVPYTVALVVVGLLITTQSNIQIEFSPALILAVLIPPLVFEAAFHIHITDLQRNLVWILILAIPGVLLTTGIVGGVLAAFTGIGVGLAFLFGAIVSATDPVAVVSLFRTLGAPKKLTVLIEGESLLNDGTAIVVFNLVLLAVLLGNIDVAGSVIDFVKVSAGGLVIGLVAGWLIARLIASIDDYLIETTLTTILAYGAYLLADRLQMSGVLAVVAAGLVNGNLGSRGMSPSTRIVLYNFWEYVAFLANSMVFLLIGMEINLASLLLNWQLLLISILAVLLARWIIIFGLGWLANRFSQEKVSRRWQAVLAWGGLRGAISLALVLSLPATLGPGREQLRVMAFGVVLFTLLVQSTTMNALVRGLRVVAHSEAEQEYQLRHARFISARAAEASLDRMQNAGLLSPSVWEQLKESISKQTMFLADKVREMRITHPQLADVEISNATRELLRVQRSTLQELRHEGVLSEESYEQLAAEVDFSLSEDIEEAPFPPEPETGTARFVEFTLTPASSAVEKTVAGLQLPEDIVIVSIRRNRQILIPRGNTRLSAEDVVSVLCREEMIQTIREILVSAPSSPPTTPSPPTN
jgi:monovalent cation:H+ antiporter, CPA1 family